MGVKSSHKATHQQADGQVFLPFEKVLVASVADMDASNKVFFPLEKGQLVRELIAVCTTTVVGGTPAVTVGDSAAADTYVAAGAALETAGNVVKSSTVKKYTATDYLVVTFNAGATAGVVELRVVFSGKEE